MSSSMVMQPKSRATVVVVFSGTSPVRSIAAATSVIAASVVSNGISEMRSTAVVLPTPNPPAMTIFTGIGGRGRNGASGDGLKSTDDPLHDLHVVLRSLVWTAHREQPERDQVTDENPGRAQMQAEL